MVAGDNMSNRSKGNRNERKCVLELEKDGWLVYRVKGTTKFNLNCDIFSLFDICARKGKKIKWVQVKSNKKPNLKPFKEFYDRYCNEYESVQVWVMKDYKGWKVYEVE